MTSDEVKALREENEILREALADSRGAIGAALACLQPLRGKPTEGDSTQKIINLGTAFLFDARDTLDAVLPPVTPPCATCNGHSEIRFRIAPTADWQYKPCPDCTGGQP